MFLRSGCPRLQAAMVTCFMIAGPATAAPRSRPNILFLMADQLRGDCLAADGNPLIRTPNLDRIAREGARFRWAYSSTPSCTPARAGLLTGLGPWRHGMLGYGRIAVRYQHEMPRMLADAGYDAVGVGKMHFHPQRNLHGFRRTILDESGREESEGFRSDYRSWFWSLAPGLDPGATGITWNDYRAGVFVHPEHLHPTRWTADVAVNYLRDYRDERPFFLMVSFARPHSPYDPPASHMALYQEAEPPAAAIGDWAERNNIKADPKEYALWRGNLGADAVRQARRAYYGSVSFVDEQIGRILAALTERGLLDNTLILFTADHGDMLGDHHLWRKTYAYEGSARVPMLVRWPERIAAPRGRVFTEPVELRDILPTFLDAAGIPTEAGSFDGRSLLDVIAGRAADWRPFIDLEHSNCYAGSESWNALTDGQFKYVYEADSGNEQLFDLKTDPHELRDLAGDSAHRERLAVWRARLIEHLSPRGPAYVRNGELVRNRKNILYSPNYPAEPPATRPDQSAGEPEGKRRGAAR